MNAYLRRRKTELLARFYCPQSNAIIATTSNETQFAFRKPSYTGDTEIVCIPLEVAEPVVFYLKRNLYIRGN